MSLALIHILLINFRQAYLSVKMGIGTEPPLGIQES